MSRFFFPSSLYIALVACQADQSPTLEVPGTPPGPDVPVLPTTTTETSTTTVKFTRTTVPAAGTDVATLTLPSGDGGSEEVWTLAEACQPTASGMSPAQAFKMADKCPVAEVSKTPLIASAESMFNMRGGDIECALIYYPTTATVAGVEKLNVCSPKLQLSDGGALLVDGQPVFKEEIDAWLGSKAPLGDLRETKLESGATVRCSWPEVRYKGEDTCTRTPELLAMLDEPIVGPQQPPPPKRHHADKPPADVTVTSSTTSTTVTTEPADPDPTKAPDYKPPPPLFYEEINLPPKTDGNTPTP